MLGGNAGIALGAAAAVDLDLAVLAVTPYLATAEPTPGGVHWEVRAGLASRFHHISHGTLGIVYALAAIGHATGRGDLVELALAGAADVVSRNEAGPDGFLVPHSDPQSTSGRTVRYNYGWCHGPAGDASTLVPRPGWAMGNAGIVRELLRYARIRDGRDPGYAVTWPDHLPAAARERRGGGAGGQAGSTS